MQIKYVHSVCSEIPRGGVGGIAYHAIGEMNKRGFLRKAYIMNWNKGGDVGKLTRFFFPPKPPHFPVDAYYAVRNALFDSFVAATIPRDADIFHGWIGHGMKSFAKARTLGIKTVTHGASLHPVEQNKILMDEFARYKINDAPLSAKTVDGYVKELKNVQYIAASCDVSAESFVRQGWDESHVFETPFGVDTTRYTPGTKSDDVFRAIFIGTVGLRKGPQYLLPAWSSWKDKGDSELVMLGPLEGTVQPIMKPFANEKGVTWVKWSDDLKGMCNEASVFVLPALEEGGTTLAQLTAMACGLPCIVTHATYFPVRDGKEGIIINERNVKQIKDALKYFKDNPSETRRMGRNARKRAEKYTWDNYGRSLEKMFKAIM
ncbi:MAG: glycosyltransferase family 4 protein [Candidatus Aenigmarchaeota archaeon]|nr:glycosyltransferase family 4 protein [Candidatus Aenigmarchaeota archaeon]